MTPSIYVAGTGQHSGKTMVSVGLVASLLNHGYRVAYMKPVGQRSVPYAGCTVDEDVALINEVFGVRTNPTLSNPVTIPSGFTREFLEKGRSPDDLMQLIRESFIELCADADVAVVEGTGHAGVGAVVGLSNARVAALLGSKAIIVTGGGIGRPLDEFELNRALFEESSVPVLGMIANKVYRERLGETTRALVRWLDQRGYALRGAVPYDPRLTDITLAQIAQEIGARIVTGASKMHLKINDFMVGAAPCHRLLRYFGSGLLMITPGDRDDLVLAAISWDETRAGEGEGMGICLTSDLLPHEDVLTLAARSQVPVIVTDEGTYDTAARISGLVAKMLANDEDKVARARRLVGEHVDVKGLTADLGLPQAPGVQGA